MSGIAAIFHRDGRPVERGQLERMSGALAMYGPEGRNVVELGEVGFVYTHFTNTPEAQLGTQPLTGGAGRFTFLFDGRISNREDLAETLGISPAQLRRMSDAALAGASWAKSGPAALNGWVGEFAAIAWDRDTRELSLIRDQFGRRPLHYHLTDKRLVVASMPKGIHALGDVPRELDRERLADVLIQFDIDKTRSYFRGIDCVAPASVMHITPNKWRSNRYYAMRDHIKPVHYKRDEDYLEAAQEQFDRALAACLRSPGAVGMQLSGGMDTSLLAAHAAPALARQGQRLSAYTWVPVEGCEANALPGWHLDESRAAEATAAMYPNIDLHLIGRDRLGIYDGLPEYILAAESVMRNTLNMALILATGRQARSDGVRVMLIGANGNLTLSYGGEGLFYELLRQGRVAQLVREIRANPDPLRQWKRLAISVLPDWLLNAYRRAKGSEHSIADHFVKHSIATPAATMARRVIERAEELDYRFALNNGRNQRDQDITLIENYIGPMEACFQAAMPALFGFEQRDPFFDRRLMEWSFGVPETQFRRLSERRFLMRRLLSGKVPPPVAEQRNGRGQQSGDWRERLKPDLSRIRKDLATASRLPALDGVLDHDRAARLLDDFPEPAETLPIQTYLDYQVALPLAASVAALALHEAGANRSADS